MAQLVNIKLSRADASPWGFRLQGGKDFGQPLLIQKVNGGSLSERAGLQVGDALVRVNGVDVQDLRHKDAQDTIVRAGNSIDMSIQRGGMSTWKPQVSAVGNVPTPGTPAPLPVTKTSLAAKPSSSPIPSGHNVSPRPFGASTPQLNGGDVKAVVNKQYNSPIGVYSEDTIAETLSAQTEVLATGALGVNFMKNERSYDSQKSEVFKMVQEDDKEPRAPEPAPLSNTKYFSTTSHAVGGRATSPRPLTPVARQMGTPELPQDKPYMPLPSPTPGSPVCSECGKHIVGVFVRIKEKNLHVECFKCATCGSSLKNVGYYTINNKLYCDIHAKMVARQNPPAPNLEPVTVAPGARIPTGFIGAPAPLPSSVLPAPLPSSVQPAPLPTSALAQPPKVARLPTSAPPAPISLPVSFPPSLPTAAPQSPQPGTLAPLPFHTPSAPAPKPFGSVTAPAPAPTTTPFAPFAPLSNLSNISAPKPQTVDLNPVIWPPIQKKVTVSEPEVISKEYEQRSMQSCRQMSICSQEVCKISEDCRGEMLSVHAEDNRPNSPIPGREMEMIVRKNVVAAAHSHAQEEKRSKRETSTTVSKISSAEHVCAQSLATQLTVMGSRGLSPVRGDSPDVLDISTKPHEIKSLLPPACVIRPMSPAQRVVFPPEMPVSMLNRSRSPSPLPRKSCLKKIPKDSSRGTPPMFVELPVVTPGPTLECKVEKLHLKPTVPVVTVTDDTEVEKFMEHHEVQEQQRQQQQESGYNRRVTEISEINETTTTNQSQITEESIRLDTLRNLMESSSTGKPQEKPLEEKMYTKNEVESIIKEELKKVFLNLEDPPKKDRPPEISINDLPAPIMPGGEMAAALSTASDRPFTPAPFPKAPELSLRPNEPKEPRKKLAAAEKYVPCPEQSEPYFPPPPPPPEKENRDERTARALREVGCRSPMTEALTTAPARAYSPLPTTAKIEASKLAALKSAKTEEKSPIISVRPPITLEGTPSAFRPTGNGNGSVIPKSTPLVYIPHTKQDKREVRMEERYGIDRTSVAQGGKTKQIVAGFEGSSSTEIIEIDEAQLAACKSTEVQYGYAVAKNPPPKPEVKSAQQKTTSGLRSDHLIPTYQQFVGDIPTRIDRVVSPGPHPVKAPSMEPKPMPQPPNLRPRTPVYHGAQDQPDVTKQKTTSGLQSASMLPVYQQFLGDIPTRIDRVVSPGPHLVKAPSMEPRPMPQPPNLSPRTPVYHGPPTLDTQKTGAGQSCWNVNTGSSTKHAKGVICSYNSSAATQAQSTTSKSVSQSSTVSKASKTSMRTSRTVSPLAGKQPVVTSSGKQTFKPDIPARSLSPSWKADYVRSVQNLSPITVRLPSPVPPHPLPPKGEKTQTTSANVMVKNKAKTTTASQPRTTTTQSAKPPTSSTGHCGTSKGCGTPPGSPKGPCGTSKGCGTPVECRSPTDEMEAQNDDNKTLNVIKNKENMSSMLTQRSEMKTTGNIPSMVAQRSDIGKENISSTMSQRSEMKGKENISSMMSQRSDISISGKANMTYTSQTTSSSSEKMLAAQKNIKGILKQKGSTLDTKPIQSNDIKRPLQLSSPNISWLPYPTNLPLPRNCGVNPSSSGPNAGGAGGLGGGRSSIAGSTAPRRGRGVLNAAVPAGGRVPLCGHCNNQIRGPFITAMGKIWCPEHFICVNPKCKRPLQDIGFVEEDAGLYCEYCFEQYLAPSCDKCRNKIKGDCLNAIGQHFHPECFKCSYCEKLFGNNPFFLEDGLPYCENDWNELFTTKCFSCGFPIEAGDRWVEALNNNYHSQCFNCTMCKKNLDGQSFFAKGGRPFCKNHAR